MEGLCGISSAIHSFFPFPFLTGFLLRIIHVTSGLVRLVLLSTQFSVFVLRDHVGRKKRWATLSFSFFCVDSSIIPSCSQIKLLMGSIIIPSNRIDYSLRVSHQVKQYIAVIAVAALAGSSLLIGMVYVKIYRKTEQKVASHLSASSDQSHPPGPGNSGFSGIHVDKSVDFSYEELFESTNDFSIRIRLDEVKQKQKGSKRMLLPSVEGQEGRNWIVIDSGKLVIHALDEKVRAHYNLEKLWSTDTSNQDHGLVQGQDLEKAFLKVRPKNNSKKTALYKCLTYDLQHGKSAVMLADKSNLFMEVVSFRNTRGFTFQFGDCY
ncbi:hypothetical protein K7X08_006268 [Anisodus acutangulus]|uniref:Uncharacterized protein n=1 Tax=Anisodus acutangulus TaxID=402998 RepID=A0A9Q1MV53_9SOLA|nr:hypothetical protein K7X08_006268 [Anisodus acutangulus]